MQRDTLRPAAPHATTTGMTGHGFYNANSQPQWAAIKAILPLAHRAAAELPVDGEKPVTLVDYGCSEGRNSIAFMKEVLGHLMPRTSLPVETVHSDLPTNDFSALLRNLRPDGRSVFGQERIYSSIAAGSMYDQLRPDQSVHFATTFNAIGFLSRRPVAALPGYILPNGPSRIRNNGVVSPQDQDAFADQARKDVAAFLSARARELVPGGKLLVQVFGAAGEARTCDGLYDLLNDAVLEAVAADVISKETYNTYYQPVYMRTLEELTSPVKDGRSACTGLFRIEEACDYEIPVHFVERYKKEGDLDLYARDYVNFFRAFTEAVLTGALPETPGRTDLVNRIYARAEDILKQAPDLYPFRYAAVAMLLTRTP